MVVKCYQKNKNLSEVAQMLAIPSVIKRFELYGALKNWSGRVCKQLFSCTDQIKLLHTVNINRSGTLNNITCLMKDGMNHKLSRKTIQRKQGYRWRVVTKKVAVNKGSCKDCVKQCKEGKD